MDVRPVRRGDVDDLSVRYVEPEGQPTGVAMWLSHLGGSAEQTYPMLERLARRGFVAMTFDLPGHGSRAAHDPAEMTSWVLSSFRRRMWPLLGQSTLESLRILDWARERFPGVALVVGGVSMGGDVGVAVAGIDQHIVRVGAMIATPDWTRPGMQSIGPRPAPIDQGEPDAYAQWFFDQLDPLTHWQRYRRTLQVRFLCGAEDTHVPPEAAHRFMELVNSGHDDPVITVCGAPGLDHLGAARHDAMYDQAADWLTSPQ